MHNRFSSFRKLLWVVTFLEVASASAQTFNIDWSTFDSGGGTSTGGVYALSGTIGQPDANAVPLTGGPYSLAGGFWSLFAVSAPGGPPLSIRLTLTNAAVISWSSTVVGFALHQNSDLNTTNWVPAPEAVIDDGTNRSIIVSPPTGRRFYRLFKPSQ